ncbi:phage tail tape measure protein [Jeotgalibaca sp. MA1X17-3]|uniref:phage tail tape measure protein n=1 Tax=Jeotgalibaca sp. MA1X17-3 TaxID=2908211 RepID=UPI001F27C8EE|nr:phage tail tape measure protein [Jeotgalibaca sp. MA1X17-3]UJF15058.1 phage tail tape measure protein [Jeotgalibaca sp. MA1X17-3]
MALRKAGISLTIEGQAAYKAGITDINREMRLLAQESKLAVAQLGTQASRQATYTNEMDNYSKRIEAATGKTKVLASRQKELPGIQNQLSKSLKTTNAAYQDSANKTERLKNNYEQMSQALGRNHEATQEAKKAYQDSKAETKLLGDEVKSLEKSFASTDKELKNIPFSLNQAELASQKLRNEAQKLHEEYRNAGGRLADTADKYRTLGDTLTRTGDVMKGVGSFATKFLTVPLLLGGTAAIKASIDFESAFAGVKKTVDEVYDSNGKLVISYADLSQGIRDMAKKLPATTTEISAVAESAGQLGIQTENVLTFSKTMIDLGESTNMGATEAATALARFANITGLSQDKFSNLGSAIVDLGNNFATTEGEIVAMALRLAGAGSQIGLSESDILGLSTALSSVGIEAEAGGSAFSKVMVNMQLAASQGGQDLEDFANIAGMSAADFKTAFETDAVGAIGAFVQGLGKAEEKGTTAIELLDEMGIKEVRLRDALLRAGNASELFADAVGTSSRAFEENTALTEEASKRYETTESKLRILKNQVTDTAIEFGGPLVDALRDGLTAAQPLIEGAGDLARRFSEMDEESQQAVIKLGLFALAGGPVLSMLGNITGGLGTASQGVGSLVQWIGKMTTPKLIGDTSTVFSTIATGATTSSTQVGTLTSVIGGLPVVLGIAGAALLGYTAWKVWGEDAWNSAQRTKEWGTDVGETVGNTLNEIKGFSDSATGQFNLMAQGVSGNTEEMSANFASMGEVIESSLKDRISKLDELIEGLPDTVKTSLAKILEEDKKQAESSLAIVEENNARIAEIRENASTHNRELSILEASIIKNINQESSEAYINTLKISQQEKQTILDAMNGDVEKSSQEEARIWAQNLGKQRAEQKNHYAEQKKDYLDALKELGYSDEALNEHEKMWDKANKATTDGIDQQLATIAEKYPELLEEVFFANGQLVDASSETAKEMLSSNQKIVEGARSLSGEIAAAAERNAEKLKWMGDEATHAGQTWNNIILDPKTGEVKSNVREVIIEAGKDSAKWNEMRFQLQNADLDSNAKRMIGEAAIANGWWDGMSWEDKEAVLQDEFSTTMYKALEETGKWDELSLPEKNAFLYSNTPEVMAQTMLDLGLWDEYQAEIKDFDADNFEILNAISQSETALAEYNQLPPELKKLLAEDPSTLTFNESQKALEDYNKVGPDLKKLLGENQNVVSKISTVEGRISNYNQNVHPGPKHLHATSDVETVVGNARNSLDGINGKIVSTYVDTYHRSFMDNIVSGAAPIGYSAGTNFHRGGDMMVNDQKGPLFEELVSFPDGRSFIPKGRNVLIPDAPRGAKVLKASLTKKQIPRYAGGVGYGNQNEFASPIKLILEINNPVIREEQDIAKLVNAVEDKLTLNTKLNHLFNKGKEGTYA